MSVMESDAKRRSRPLIRGTKMTCPRCKVERDILDFKRMEEIEEFAAHTTPVYKCPKSRGGCSWEFAPAESSILSSMMTGRRDG